MDIEIDELLSLLSDRIKAEMAQDELDNQRNSKIRVLLKQQEYLLAAIREFFTEFAERVEGLEDQLVNKKSNDLLSKIIQRIDDLETLIGSGDLRYKSLQKQLAQEVLNLSRLQEEQASLGGQTSNRLLNQLAETRKRIERIKEEMEAEKDDYSG